MNRHWLISSGWTYKLRFTNFFERNETNVSFIFFYYNEIVYWIKKIGTNIMMMDSERREERSFVHLTKFDFRLANAREIATVHALHPLREFATRAE